MFRIGLILVAIPIGLWLLHRFAIMLEDAGYLYYRKPKEGGSAGGSALNQMDFLVRPSVEHTREAEEVSTIVRDDVGGD